MPNFITRLQEAIRKKSESLGKQKQILKLFLTGLGGQLQKIHYPKPYNYYINVAAGIATFLFARWIIDCRKTEIQKQGYNWLVPSIVYQVREDSYIYWETVRVAQGLPATFTYYKWDENLMYEVDRRGKQTPFHTHRGLEDQRTFTSPLHEYLFPASPETHSKILQYLKNINNPYDLYNYLRQKPVNMGDWLRAGYYLVYRKLGLTNRWRYDEFVSKPAIYYRWQKLRWAFRLSRDRQNLYKTLDQIQLKKEDILTFLFWFL